MVDKAHTQDLMKLKDGQWDYEAMYIKKKGQ